jgi:hypothetical protein
MRVRPNKVSVLEVSMPELLPDGLPERANRSRLDFNEWADGQAWRFVRGEDYTSTTGSFRSNLKRWAKAHGYIAETRPLPATDARGRPLAASKADPIGLAVRFMPAPGERQVARMGLEGRQKEAKAA